MRGVAGCCGVSRAGRRLSRRRRGLSRRRRGLSRRRRGRVAACRTAIAVYRDLSRRRRGRVPARCAAVAGCRGVSRAIFLLSKPRHVIGHPKGGVKRASAYPTVDEGLFVMCFNSVTQPGRVASRSAARRGRAAHDRVIGMHVGQPRLASTCVPRREAPSGGRGALHGASPREPHASAVVFIRVFYFGIDAPTLLGMVHPAVGRHVVETHWASSERPHNTRCYPAALAEYCPR